MGPELSHDNFIKDTSIQLVGVEEPSSKLLKVDFNLCIIATILANIIPFDNITTISRTYEIKKLFTKWDETLSLRGMSRINIGVNVFVFLAFVYTSTV